MILLYQEQIRRIRKVIQENQTEMASLVEYLENCIQRLLSEEEIVKEYPLAPVLCHMDLQPQNMILCQTTKLPTPTIPMIASILDWEESCYADARFEILLMCRKVLANREQADSLWHHYSERVKATAGFSVGPIEPWLRLESVHTLLTMCMQGMNLLQGGRNPWEEESDLLKKIDRELYRLRNDLGWEA
jgi:thiamine kinase-like enzyme